MNPVVLNRELHALRTENEKLKQENEDLSDINSMLKKGMERHSNCPLCKLREPPMRPRNAQSERL